MGAARRREAPFPENAADTGQLGLSVRLQYTAAWGETQRSRSRLRLLGEARRHGTADVFEAGEPDAALARTGRGAPELDLKRPEQSLKLSQREVPQLAAGDDLRHPISPVCREAPTNRAFPAARGVIIVRERPAGGG